MHQTDKNKFIDQNEKKKRYSHNIQGNQRMWNKDSWIHQFRYFLNTFIHFHCTERVSKKVQILAKCVIYDIKFMCLSFDPLSILFFHSSSKTTCFSLNRADIECWDLAYFLVIVQYVTQLASSQFKMTHSLVAINFWMCPLHLCPLPTTVFLYLILQIVSWGTLPSFSSFSLLQFKSRAFYAQGSFWPE